MRWRAACGDAVAVSVRPGKRSVFLSILIGFSAGSVGVAMLAVLNSRSTGKDTSTFFVIRLSAIAAEAEKPIVATMMRIGFMSFSILCGLRLELNAYALRAFPLGKRESSGFTGFIFAFQRASEDHRNISSSQRNYDRFIHGRRGAVGSL